MSLPSNVHISQHPSLQAKLSQLRSKSAGASDVKSLIHDISLILACEALPHVTSVVNGSSDETPLGFEYTTKVLSPGSISLVPILRSGLSMVDAVQTILPDQVPVHHLGMYREMTTLDPVEYYNNLPYHIPDPAVSAETSSAASSLVIIVDPVIATGGTCAAAISTLREWGAQKILVLTVLGALEGVEKAAREWAEGAEIWLAGMDEKLTSEGMLQPGLGDVGDRLYLTLGK